MQLKIGDFKELDQEKIKDRLALVTRDFIPSEEQ